MDPASGYRYYRASQARDADGDVEICIPIGAEVDTSHDEVDFKTVPGGTVAATTHRGPYDEISPAYHTVTGWIQDHGHRIAGPPREIDLNDPKSEIPDDLLTEIQFPIEATDRGHQVSSTQRGRPQASSPRGGRSGWLATVRPEPSAETQPWASSA